VGRTAARQVITNPLEIGMRELKNFSERLAERWFRSLTEVNL
jgi:hypothetical protein